MVKHGPCISVRLPKLSPKASMEYKALVCSNIITSVCQFYGVSHKKVLSPIPWGKAHTKAVSAIIYILTEIGIERYEVARLTKRQPETMASNLYRLRGRIENPQHKKEFINCVREAKKQMRAKKPIPSPTLLSPNAILVQTRMDFQPGDA